MFEAFHTRAAQRPSPFCRPQSGLRPRRLRRTPRRPTPATPRRARFADRRRDSVQPRRPAQLPAGLLRPLFAAAPPTTCWSRCPASPSAPRATSAGSARRARTCSSTASGSPTSRAARSQQLRLTDASVGRADRPGRRRPARHRGPPGPGRQRHPQEGRRRQRPVHLAARIPRPLFAIHLLCAAWSATPTASGPVEYTLSADNTNIASRGAYGGNDDLIYDASATLIERRVGRLFSDFTSPSSRSRPRSTCRATRSPICRSNTGPIGTISGSRKAPPRRPQTTASATSTQTQRGYMLDFNGDYEFALGPGRLKLIGLHHYRARADLHHPDHPLRKRHRRRRRPLLPRRPASVEFILRGEYGWKGGSNDWQVTLERAVNTLDQKGELFLLSPDGEWVEDAVPARHRRGRRTSLRSDSPPSSRPLNRRRSTCRSSAGAEISKLERLDEHDEARKFFRPKGSVSLAWRPSRGLGHQPQAQPPGRADQLLRLPRPARPQRRPRECRQPRSRARRKAGSWRARQARSSAPGAAPGSSSSITASTTSSTSCRSAMDGQSIGNLPRATKVGGEFTSHHQLRPDRLDAAPSWTCARQTRSRVKDPLTGESRPISGITDYSGSIDLRHDIPGTDIAWGGDISINHNDAELLSRRGHPRVGRTIFRQASSSSTRTSSG